MTWIIKKKSKAIVCIKRWNKFNKMNSESNEDKTENETESKEEMLKSEAILVSKQKIIKTK